MNKREKIKVTVTVAKRLRKIKKKDKDLAKKISETLKLLLKDQFYPSLRTHKVKSKYGEHFSSWVTGDIRILWNFDEDELSLIVVAIGGHSGSKSIY